MIPVWILIFSRFCYIAINWILLCSPIFTVSIAGVIRPVDGGGGCGKATTIEVNLFGFIIIFGD